MVARCQTGVPNRVSADLSASVMSSPILPFEAVNISTKYWPMVAGMAGTPKKPKSAKVRTSCVIQSNAAGVASSAAAVAAAFVFTPTEALLGEYSLHSFLLGGAEQRDETAPVRCRQACKPWRQDRFTSISL